MPSSPRIPKEKTLSAALTLLIREGYGAVTIKALASELNCSTQPISWHFGNMEGLRQALVDYALEYANNKMRSDASVPVQVLTDMGDAYLSMAFDEPNLFSFLYMSDFNDSCHGSLTLLLTDKQYAEMVDGIAEQFKITIDAVQLYVLNTIVYVQGLASFVASGLIKADKAEFMTMLHCAADTFLIQAGAESGKKYHIGRNK